MSFYLPLIAVMVTAFLVSSIFIRPLPGKSSLSNEPLCFDKSAVAQRISAVNHLTSYEKLGWLAANLRYCGLNIFKFDGAESGFIAVSEGVSQRGKPISVIARLNGFYADSSIIASLLTISEAIASREHQQNIIFSATYDDPKIVENEITKRFGRKSTAIVLDLQDANLRKLKITSGEGKEPPLWAVGVFKRALGQQGIETAHFAGRISESDANGLEILVSTGQELTGSQHPLGFARTLGSVLERVILTLDEIDRPSASKPYLLLPFSMYLPYESVWICLLVLISVLFLRTVELLIKSKWTKLSVLWKRKSFRGACGIFAASTLIIAVTSALFSKFGLRSPSLYPLGWSFALMAISRRGNEKNRSFPSGYRTILLSTTNCIFSLFLITTFIVKPLTLIPLLPSIYLWVFITSNPRGKKMDAILLLAGVTVMLLLRPERYWGNISPFMLTAILFYALSVWKVIVLKEEAAKKVVVLEEDYYVEGLISNPAVSLSRSAMVTS